MRWKTGDIVVHSRDGICTVTDIREMTMSGEPQQYYILEPVYERGSKLYIPLDKEAMFLRAPATEEQIITYIQNLPDAELTWIADEKQRQRNSARSDFTLLQKTD